MTTEKLEIPLHDRSFVQVSLTDLGTIYLELYAPGTLKDGHGFILKGSTLLGEETLGALRELLTSPREREAA